MDKSEKKNQKKSVVLSHVAVVHKWAACIIVLVVVLAGLGGCAPGSDNSMPPSSAPAPAAVSSAPAESEPVRVAMHDINFEDLQARNSDAIAWIEVPNTRINDPVMLGIDNEFYLQKDIDLNYYVGGSVFIDMSNSGDFTDPVTVAYGHFMPDGSLFTDLHLYRDADFFAENRDVFVYLPDRTLQYEVVAALNIGVENVLYNRDYTKAYEMQGFIDRMSMPRDLEANVNMDGATTDDRFLVLSTCQSVQDNTSRYIVVARLISE